MSDKIKVGLTNLSLITGITVGVFGALQAYAVLPYRLEQAEREVRALKDERKVDREILIRIEEQVKAMREEMKRVK